MEAGFATLLTATECFKVPYISLTVPLKMSPCLSLLELTHSLPLCVFPLHSVTALRRHRYSDCQYMPHLALGAVSKAILVLPVRK